MTKKSAASSKKVRRSTKRSTVKSGAKAVGAKKAKTASKLKVAAPLPVTLKKIEPRPNAPMAVGAQPNAHTIIYIHGIGNKPPASVLKCQWDNALFNVDMGDRTRLVYWVNREYYPLPSDETCIAEDDVHIDDDEITTQSILALAQRAPADEDAAIKAEIDALTSDPNQRKWLAALSDELTARAATEPASIGARDVRAKILPLPPFLRRLITRKITRAFLRDVNDFLFNAQRRQVMEQALVDRLTAGGGPFVIIAHSQGSIIAYDVLRQLTTANCKVPLFVTIGSPLGISEVQDVLRQWIPDGVLRVPECVTRWVNVADPFDPVAADKTLADEYSCAPGQTLEDFIRLNPESPLHPHSGTGYLRTAPVQDELLEVVGNAFSQPVSKFVIAKDLVATMEDGRREERYPTLIQLATKVEGSIDVVRRELVDAIRAMIRDGNGGRKSDVGSELERAGIEPLKRYVAAQLTRLEIEQLRARFVELKIERVWRDATKRMLVFASTHTIQTSPAVLGYGATGRDIGWAVLDTGIRADHPHFREYKNIKRQWDCTKPGPPQEFSPGDTKFDELDKQGHGTHVAGIIGGNKEVPLKAGAKASRFSGMAPETAIYGFKVLDDRGNGQDSWIIKALDRIAEFNESAGRLVIAGVNLSLGGNFDPSVYACGHTPLCEELRRLWNQGVLVCLAAGNEGYALLQSEQGQIPSNMDLSIGDPANLDEALAVGSIHKTNPHTYGVSYFSSRGPTADGRRKPDLVAPGERILSALHSFKAPVTGAEQTVEDLYVEMSGTSMAAPHVSGLLAGFLSVRREFIGYPDRVKRILLDNCTDLGRDQYIQGRGMPNLIRMLANS